MKLNSSSRSAGFIAAVVGVLAIGPDAALLRAARTSGGSTSIIGVWRYLLLSVCNVALAAICEGGTRRLLAGMRRSLGPVLGASAIIVAINAGFTLSLLNVNPAIALLLISLSPLWAALLGKVLLGDSLPTRTVVAQMLSLVATLVVFVPDFSAMVDEDPGTPGLELIDLVPLATGLAVAALLTYSRWQANASLEAAPALGALLTAVAAAANMLLLDGEPVGSLVDGLPLPFWLALCGSAVGSALYDSALVIAPRSLTSTEVALILLAETILGPLWVWIAYGEVPDEWTLAGGGMLLATLIGHELAGMRDASRAADAAVGSAHSTPGFCSSNSLFIMGGHRSPRLRSFERSGSRPPSLDLDAAEAAEADKRLVPLLTEDHGGLMLPSPLLGAGA